MVEGTRSMIALLESNENIAKAALINSMGLEWDTSIELSEKIIPFTPYQANLRELISSVYVFNPNWSMLESGLKAAEAGIQEARSGYRPTVACFGVLNRIDNEYDYGVVNSRMRNSWVIGVNIELSIFDGFQYNTVILSLL